MGPLSPNATVYLAGPMRGRPWCNFPAFDRAAAELRAQGYVVMSPAEHDRELGFEPDEAGTDLAGWDLHAAMRWDVGAVLGCDAVALLPGWERSVGVRTELSVGRAIGKPVYEYRHGALRSLPGAGCPILVGISGWARSGKDSLAGLLVDRHGFSRIGFADRVKCLTGVLYPEVATIAAEQGWDATKAQPAVRELLQDIGLAARRVLGEDVWVDAALGQLDPAGRYVITDVRFQNEARALRAMVGTLVRIIRPGVAPVNDHVSETALDVWTDWDFEVVNDGSLCDLADAAERIAHVAEAGPAAASASWLGV